MISNDTPLSRTGLGPARDGRSPRAATAAAAARVLAAAALLSLAAGCSAPKPYRYSEPAAEPPVSPAVRTVAGDWDDVDAALKASFARCKVATLSRSEVIDDQAFDPASPPSMGVPLRAIELEVLTIAGQTGSLTLERGEPAGRDGSHEITITCRIGPTGDAASEACVTDSIADRLGQLRGRLYAPLRWSD